MSQKSRARPQQPTSAQLLRLEFKEVVEDAMGCQFGSSFVLSVPGSLTVKELMSEIFVQTGFNYTQEPKPEHFFPLKKGVIYKNQRCKRFGFTTTKKVPVPGLPRVDWKWNVPSSSGNLNTTTLAKAGLKNGAVLVFRSDSFSRGETKVDWYHITSLLGHLMKMIFLTTLLLGVIVFLAVIYKDPRMASSVAYYYFSTLSPNLKAVPGGSFVTSHLDTVFQSVDLDASLLDRFLGKARNWFFHTLNLLESNNTQHIDSVAWPSGSKLFNEEWRLDERTPSYQPLVSIASMGRIHLDFQIAKQLYDYLRHRFPNIPVDEEGINHLGRAGAEHVLVLEDSRSSMDDKELLQLKNQHMVFVAVIPSINNDGFHLFTINSSAILQLSWNGGHIPKDTCEDVIFDRKDKLYKAVDRLNECQAKDTMWSKADCATEQRIMREAKTFALTTCRKMPDSLGQSLVDNLHDRLKLAIANAVRTLPPYSDVKLKTISFWGQNQAVP